MFISNAYAQSAGSGFGDGGLMSYLPIVLMFVVLYFLMIRPQQKRVKEQRNMLESLSVGDEVVTGGGILGIISSIDGNIINLEIAQGVEVMLQKSAVAGLMPKGTINLSNKSCSMDSLPNSSSCCG